MSISSHKSDLPTTTAAESVMTWKANVESFFHDEWGRLRALIMTLEEELWNDGNSAGTATSFSASHGKQSYTPSSNRIQKILGSANNSPFCQSDTDQVTLSTISAAPDDAAAIPEETVSAERLSELAVKLEHRLKTVIASRR